MDGLIMKPRRIFKTVSLGAGVIVALIFGLVHVLEMPIQQALSMLLASIFIVLGIALLALFTVFILRLLARLYRKYAD